MDFECFPVADQPLFRINSPVAPDMQYLITVVSKYGCPIRDEDSCVLKDASGGAPTSGNCDICSGQLVNDQLSRNIFRWSDCMYVLSLVPVETEYNLGPLVGTTFTTNSSETPFPYDYYVGICTPIRDR